MAGVVLDSTVPIDYLRGDEACRAWLLGLAGPVLASEITRVEVLRGVRSPERAGTERLLAGLVWVPLDEPISRLAGDLGRQHRRSHRTIGAADLIVAATALHMRAELATANVRHYPMFKNLRPPY